MSIALALITGALVFFAGFCLGLNPPSQTRARVRDRLDFERIMSAQAEQYKNFLNYDGSVQS